MFGIDSAELLIIAVVALLVIGPKDLPRVMRTVGNVVARARDMARHFRSGMDAMMREAELEEMEKKWKADNERIMREHPMPPPAPPETGDSGWGKSAAEAEGPAVPPPGRAKAPPIPGAEAPAASVPPPAGKLP